MKNNLALARRFRALTQTELSKVTQISKTSISNIEIGIQGVSLLHAIKLCKALKLPMDLIFPDSDIDVSNEDIISFYDYALEKSQTVL